jgi:hypothetical protein
MIEADMEKLDQVYAFHHHEPRSKNLPRAGVVIMARRCGRCKAWVTR